MPMLPTVVAFILGIVSYSYAFPNLTTVSLLLIVTALILGYSACIRSLKNGFIRGAMVMLVVFFLGSLITCIYEQRHKVIFPDERVDIDVVVADTPKLTDYGCLLDGIVVAPEFSFDGKTVRCYLNCNPTQVAIGQTLSIRGRLRQIKNKSTGNFNYELWAKSHGIAGQIHAYDVNYTTTMLERLGAWNRFVVKTRILRKKLLDRYREEARNGDSHLSAYNEEQILIAAMAFGERSGIGQDMRDRFAVTGASHLLALSGMHLGILYVLLSFIAVRHKRRFFGQIILMLTIWTYVVLVGMPLSVVRAAIMLTIYSVSTLARRTRMSVNALCLAAWIMLLINPVSIWDVGFQMSFMAMIGIFACFDPLYRLVDIEFLFSHSLFKKVWALVCASVAAQVTTMPLAVYYFGRLPLMFLLTNLVAIPLVTALLYAVFLSVLFWIVPFIRTILIKISLYVASWLMSAVAMLSRIDYISINDISINWVQLMLIYVVIILVAVMIVFIWHIRTYDMYREQMTNRF